MSSNNLNLFLGKKYQVLKYFLKRSWQPSEEHGKGKIIPNERIYTSTRANQNDRERV